MSDIWYLKRWYMQITIKMLQVTYRLDATSMLRNHKHARIETSTTRRWFNHSLSKQLICLLLNNGWWATATLTLNCQKLLNKGGWYLSWRWWPKTILSTNLLHVMLLHWSKNLKAYRPEKLQMKMMRRLRTVKHQEHLPLQPYNHSVHTWCGPMIITRLHICLPQVSSKGLQWCKPQWLSPQG